MKKTDNDIDISDVILFIVLAICLVTIAVMIWAIAGTLLINALLVLFSVSLAPLSVWEGFQVMVALWLILMMIRPPSFRRNKE